MLELLDKAMAEYEQHVGRSMTYGEGDGGGGFIAEDKPLPNVSRYDVPVVVYNQTQPSGVGFLEDYSVDSTDFDSWEKAVRQRAGEQLMDRVLDRLQGVASCRKILARISPEFWNESGVDVKFLDDAWQRPLVAVFPGRDWYSAAADASGLNDFEIEDTTETSLKDLDGTIRTFEERAFGPARGERIYFMSAGPDGRYGWLGFTAPSGTPYVPDAEDKRYRRTEDNLHSYEVRQW
jgi:hypothetical protein